MGRHHPSRLAIGLAALALACTEEPGEGLDAGVSDAEAEPVWVIETDVPTSEDLLSVWGHSADDVWAVGWNGTILHYDGTAWNLESTTATVPLTSVHGLERADTMADPPETPSTVFAVGWGGNIVSRDPTTATWVDAAPTSTITNDLFGVWVGLEDRAVAVGDNGRVMVWDGMMWTHIRFQVPGEFTGALIEPKTTLKGVWSGNGNRYYVIGAGGAAYRSSGGPTSWAALDTMINTPLRGVWGPSTNDIFAVGLEGLIMRFNGSWRRVRNDGAEELPKVFFFGVDGIGGGDITIAGWRGVIVRFLDGEWMVEPTGVEEDLRDVWVDPLTEVAYAVGASGRILRRDPPPPPDDAGVQ